MHWISDLSLAWHEHVVCVHVHLRSHSGGNRQKVLSCCILRHIGKRCILHKNCIVVNVVSNNIPTPVEIEQQMRYGLEHKKFGRT